jgi:hypothetical protein
MADCNNRGSRMNKSLKYNVFLWLFFLFCIFADFLFFEYKRRYGFGLFLPNSLFEYKTWNVFMVVGMIFLAFKGTRFVGCEVAMINTKATVALFDRINNFYAKMILRLLFTAMHVLIAYMILVIVLFIFTCGIHLLPGDCTM